MPPRAATPGASVRSPFLLDWYASSPPQALTTLAVEHKLIVLFVAETVKLLKSAKLECLVDPIWDRRSLVSHSRGARENSTTQTLDLALLCLTKCDTVLKELSAFCSCHNNWPQAVCSPARGLSTWRHAAPRMNDYDLLGVPRTATQDQVGALRRPSAVTHSGP